MKPYQIKDGSLPMQDDEKFELRVLWGSFGPQPGQWAPNHGIAMSADEQWRQNQETLANYQAFVAAAGELAEKG